MTLHKGKASSFRWNAGGIQHAVADGDIMEASERYGVRLGDVTVKALCGASVVPTRDEYGKGYEVTCKRCDRWIEKRAAADRNARLNALHTGTYKAGE